MKLVKPTSAMCHIVGSIPDDEMAAMDASMYNEVAPMSEDMDVFTLEHVLERWRGYVESLEDRTMEAIENALRDFENSYGGMYSDVAVAIEDEKQLFINVALGA
jgi:hypothetical protein